MSKVETFEQADTLVKQMTINKTIPTHVDDGIKLSLYAHYKIATKNEPSVEGGRMFSFLNFEYNAKKKAYDTLKATNITQDEAKMKYVDLVNKFYA